MDELTELQKEEMERLSEEEEIFDLETLITGGTDVKYNVVIQFPKQEADGTFRSVKASAIIRPLNNVEWNNALTIGFNKAYNTSAEVEIVKKGLFTKSGEQFPSDLIDDMDAGVVTQLARKIADISGVSLNREVSTDFIKDLVGF